MANSKANNIMEYYRRQGTVAPLSLEKIRREMQELTDGKTIYVCFDFDGTLCNAPAFPREVLISLYKFFDRESRSVTRKRLCFVKFQAYVIKYMLSGGPHGNEMTREDYFVDTLSQATGLNTVLVYNLLDKYYATDFVDVVNKTHKPIPTTVNLLKELSQQKNVKVIVASSPYFRADAMRVRMRAAGIDPDDVAYVAGADNTSEGKKNSAFYAAIARQLGVRLNIEGKSTDVNMFCVGNTVGKDTPVELGIRAILIKDTLVGKTKKIQEGVALVELSHVPSLVNLTLKIKVNPPALPLVHTL